MADAEHLSIRTIAAEIGAAKSLFEEGLNTLSSAIAKLENISTELREQSIARLPVSDIPPSHHRREHRFGRPSKIETDPELKAFLLARADRLTFEEMAADVAMHFPSSRRVGKSSIHRWWSLRKR